MKYKIDNILLVILWLLAVTLGGAFWLNTKFGFDIFSASHWQYLSIIQASGGHINIWFYVSISAIIAITIVGLYLIIHPHAIARRHKLIKQKSAATCQTNLPTPAPQTPVPTTTKNPDRPRSPYQGTIVAQPPALNIPHQPSPTTSDTFNSNEISEIFESAGYVVKKAPRINDTKLDLFAVGVGEVLWIGAHNISGQKMHEIIDKLHNVFIDTLDDIEITINAFIVSPSEPTDNGILTFDSVETLAQYMSEHKNQTLPDDDDGNFDAYSEYMSTVAEYIGNV